MDKWITADNKENKDKEITKDRRTHFKYRSNLKYQLSSTCFAISYNTSNLHLLHQIYFKIWTYTSESSDRNQK